MPTWAALSTEPSSFFSLACFFWISKPGGATTSVRFFGLFFQGDRPGVGLFQGSTGNCLFYILEVCYSVILQDAAVLIHNGRPNCLFSLPVFNTELFQAYQAQVVEKVMGAGLDEERGGSTTAIQRSMDVALPGFCDRLHNIHTEVHNVSKDVTWIDNKVSKFEQKQDAINRQIHHYLQHMAAFRLPTEADGTTTTAGARGSTNLIPQKTLIRQHSAVSSMWKEWLGLEDFKEDDFSGGIEELEKTLGNRWRKHYSAAEQKQFSRLKCIIEFIKDRVHSGESLEVLLEEGDALMKAKTTLTSLHNHVRKAKSFRLVIPASQSIIDPALRTV
eukprot:jgi/Psemu1/48033/gm1.48033_g